MVKQKRHAPTLSPQELLLLTVSDIIKELIAAHKSKRDVNLNKLKTRIASKHGCPSQPRLVDIISAVPPEYRKILLPKLKAKPLQSDPDLGTPSGERLLSTKSGCPLNRGQIRAKFIKSSAVALSDTVGTVRCDRVIRDTIG
eukprot:sb/3474153/